MWEFKKRSLMELWRPQLFWITPKSGGESLQRWSRTLSATTIVGSSVWSPASTLAGQGINCCPPSSQWQWQWQWQHLLWNFGRQRIQAFHNPNSLLVPFWNPNSQTFSILSLSAVFLGATQIFDSNALPWFLISKTNFVSHQSLINYLQALPKESIRKSRLKPLRQNKCAKLQVPCQNQNQYHRLYNCHQYHHHQNHCHQYHHHHTKRLLFWRALIAT